MKRRRPRAHYRVVRTRNGWKRVLINPKVKKKARKRYDSSLIPWDRVDERLFRDLMQEKAEIMSERKKEPWPGYTQVEVARLDNELSLMGERREFWKRGGL